MNSLAFIILGNLIKALISFVSESIQTNCDPDIGCGRQSLGCPSLCPFGFPCTANEDCFSSSCTSWYCDQGTPGPNNGPSLPPPTNDPSSGSSAATWSIGDISSVQSFGKIAKDSYGENNRAFVKDPVGTGTVFQVRYPKGSFKPSASPVGGTGFYAVPIDLTKSNTVTLSYKVFFPSGFQYVKGGKLPGLYGGHPGCSGGNAAIDCFSTRFMFRANGLGEIYTYVDAKKQVPAYCKIPPLTLCNPVYGDSLGRGAYSYSPGKWTTVSQTITLNTIGNTDGKVLVIVDGQKVISFDQISWRNAESVGFLGIDFETFFGGSDSSWASPSDQFAYFKDFSLTI